MIKSFQNYKLTKVAKKFNKKKKINQTRNKFKKKNINMFLNQNK